jgi:hypothetical protein
MKGMVDLSEWRDAIPLDPDVLQFVACRAKTCRGCAFEHQWADVCGKAQAAATRAALKNCESGFIYVLVPADPREPTLKV